VFQPRWSGADPDRIVCGDPVDSDEPWTLDFGAGGERPGRVILHRPWERGPFLPVSRRVAPILTDRLSILLERGERQDLDRRFERFKRIQKRTTLDTESLLDSARTTLSRTRLDLDRARGYGEMIGTSKAMEEVYTWVRRWGPKDIPLIVQGESGTGKELVARAVHRASPRREGPLFAVNCTAVAESLLESEIFGHVKGAFTGAEETRPGLFELASGGTLVLDEVGDMSARMQAQLLRVLEEKRVRRLGAEADTDVDVRVVALANRDLAPEMKAGRFRPDLYHRLNGAALDLPPLRKRKEDIPLLAGYFLSQFREGGGDVRITKSVSAALMKYRWPGNVRELRNQLQRASVLAEGRRLRPSDFAHLGRSAVTRSSLSEGLLARLRDAVTRAGTGLEPRHEDLFRVLAGGGVIRRGEYEELSGISPRTANRDLERFVSLGLLEKMGRGRATAYRLDRGPMGEA
jgi:transcriptional regulator with GAF, ATPase, and Fis domain